MIVCIEQLFVDIFGEFCVYRQIDEFADIVTSRKFDGKLHDGIRSFAGMHVRFVLFRRQNLFKQHAQLDFSDVAACLHIAEDTFQTTDILCQRLHFSESFLHAFQLFGDKTERLSDPVIQCLLKFFIHRYAYFIQTLFRIGNQQALLFVQTGELFALQGIEGSDPPIEGIPKFVHGARQFFPVVPGDDTTFFPVQAKVFPKVFFDAFK